MEAFSREQSGFVSHANLVERCFSDRRFGSVSPSSYPSGQAGNSIIPCRGRMFFAFLAHFCGGVVLECRSLDGVTCVAVSFLAAE